jgi:hypothetical protein
VNEAAFVLKRIMFEEIRLSCEGKAPEGWRTPKRWRVHLTHPGHAKRLGVRWPSTALAWRHSYIPYAQARDDLNYQSAFFNNAYAIALRHGRPIDALPAKNFEEPFSKHWCP